jgi:hypothetical protein
MGVVEPTSLGFVNGSLTIPTLAPTSRKRLASKQAPVNGPGKQGWYQSATKA